MKLIGQQGELVSRGRVRAVHRSSFLAAVSPVQMMFSGVVWWNWTHDALVPTEGTKVLNDVKASIYIRVVFWTEISLFIYFVKTFNFQDENKLCTRESKLASHSRVLTTEQRENGNYHTVWRQHRWCSPAGRGWRLFTDSSVRDETSLVQM